MLLLENSDPLTFAELNSPAVGFPKRVGVEVLPKRDEPLFPKSVEVLLFVFVVPCVWLGCIDLFNKSILKQFIIINYEWKYSL